MDVFFIENDELLEKYDGYGITSVIVLRKNLNANPSTIKSFWKPKAGLTVMRWQIFNIKKNLKWTIIILV